MGIFNTSKNGVLLKNNENGSLIKEMEIFGKKIASKK
jgi:hypothetical protein